MTGKDPLLQPFQLKHLKLRNRVMSTSHAPAYAEDGMPKERYQRYHEEKARGGIALSMFGGSSNIDVDSPSVFGQLYVGDDDVIPYFQAFSERMHELDTAIMCQLTHMGRRTTWNAGNWLSTVAPSRVREPAHRSFPKEMDQEDIDRVVKAFGRAAWRCREGGLDGIEILAHGHLVDQFMSPATNHRTDGYGGSIANRTRFAIEVLEEVRRQVGDDFITGIRFGASEEFDGGLTADEGLEILKLLEATGLLDFVNLNRGHIETERALAYHIPGMGLPAVPGMEVVAAFRREIDLPIMHAGKIADVATARHMVHENLVDLVGMTRAHIADPHIVRKIAAGEEERIRPCVGAGYCLDRIYESGEALCIHNAATGREGTMPHVIETAAEPGKKAVVVGGGPAGMEAARVLSGRGHRVVLFEATDRLGGQVALAARASWRRDLIGIVDWFAAELDRLGVDLRFNCYAEADDIQAEAPDIVVVATGGMPDSDCVEGGEHCVSVWDILGGTTTPGDSILVYDDNGQHQGPSCADYLSDLEKDVELVTPDRMVAAEMGAINYPRYLEHFYAKGVALTPDTRVVNVAPEGNRLKVTLRNEYSDKEDGRIVDQVVVEHGTVPMTELYYGLRDQSSNGGIVDYDALMADRPQPADRNPEGRFQLFRVGDAVSSRNIHAAIYDALRLCKDL